MERIGRYLIERELGRGGCGIVYLGRDLMLQREVAIKTLKADGRGTLGGNLQNRLAREAQSAGGLNHPAIVTVYELGEDGDLMFIAMEYVDGEPLDVMMARERISRPQALRYLRSTAMALDFAHSRGIIHRDVKPANILVSKSGLAKITDFGVAKILEEATMTTTGMAVGTPSYMSPEQILTKPLDGRADQFSLGVLAFELLTGRKPFNADSLPGLIHQILSVEAPNATSISAEVKMPLAAVLQQVLNKQPENRYPNCVAFIDAIEAVLDQDAVPAEPAVETAVPAPDPAPVRVETKEITVPPAARNRMSWAVPVAILSLGLAGWMAFSSRPANAPDVPSKPEIQPAAAVVPSPGPSAAVPTGAGASTKTPVAAAPPAAVPAVTSAVPKERPLPKKTDTAVLRKESEAAPVPAPPVPVPVAAGNADPGPDPPARNYTGSPDGRFSWTGTLPPGERLVIVRNRVRMGSISNSGLPGGVPVQVTVRPADMRVVQQPSAANGFRLIVVNQSANPVNSISIIWQEQ